MLRGLKGFRRVLSRLDKLGFMFTGIILFALIVEALRSVKTL